jgi:hypothetical protein
MFVCLGLPYSSIEDLYSREYDYDEDNEVSEEGDVMKAPGFVSETMNLVVNEGETIRLPCIVTRYEHKLRGILTELSTNFPIVKFKLISVIILGFRASCYYGKRTIISSLWEIKFLAT